MAAADTGALTAAAAPAAQPAAGAASANAATAAAAGEAAVPEAADGRDSDAISLDISLQDEEEDDAAALVPPRQVALFTALDSTLDSPGSALDGTSRAATALLEVHIAHHSSYGVPLLLFRARRVGCWGSQTPPPPPPQPPQQQRQRQQQGEAQPYLSFEELLVLLAEPLARHADGGSALAAAADHGCTEAPPGCGEAGGDRDGGGSGAAAGAGWAYVALMPHPVLGHTWAALHPCRTAAWMRLLLLEAQSSGPHQALAASGSRSNSGGGDVGSSGGGSAGGLSPGVCYLVAWFSAAGRAIGLRCPLPSPAAADG